MPDVEFSTQLVGIWCQLHDVCRISYRGTRHGADWRHKSGWFPRMSCYRQLQRDTWDAAQWSRSLNKGRVQMCYVSLTQNKPRTNELTFRIFQHAILTSGFVLGKRHYLPGCYGVRIWSFYSKLIYAGNVTQKLYSFRQPLNVRSV